MMQQPALKRGVPRLIDFHPPRADIRADVLAGLTTDQKTLPSKYFYDAQGSRLFEAITRLPEYYLTRTEKRIMDESQHEIAVLAGPNNAVIEFGSGTGEKINKLLQHLQDPVACMTVEISRGHLLSGATCLATEWPCLEVIAVCADFTRPFRLPAISSAERNLVFFPGSTVGNFAPPEAVNLLKVMNQVAGNDGALLVGVDLAKDRQLLEAAYNDSASVTAAFNLNLLRRINRELGADFHLDGFRHEAIYNEVEGRIEMYLVSLHTQQVRIGGMSVQIENSERILTEYSHKYELQSFAELAALADFRVERVWMDEQQLFSVQFLVREHDMDDKWAS